MMNRGRIKRDEPESQPSRAVPRQCGQLLGRLDELLPCLYIAQYGASGRELRARVAESAPGLFALGERTGGDRARVAPRVGLILPVRFCRDEKARASLEEIPALIEDQNTTMSDRRCAVQARLDAAFGGKLMVADRECVDGFFALAPGPGLFSALHGAFDYVTEVLDNPAGVVGVSKTAHFHWQSYGELMEWYHGLRGSARFGAWSPLTPVFVCGNTGALRSYSTERWARAGLHRPAEEPSKWFVIRPGLPDAQIGVRFEMEQHGWAKLHLTLDAAIATIDLSEVFDPFEELLAWGREIEEGDLPIQLEIDEEGREAVLTVLRTEDPERVLLRVTRKHLDEVLLEGLVARAALASTFKVELRRFFATDFDGEHWDLRGFDPDSDDEDQDDLVSVKDRMLSDIWLASSR